MPEDVTPGASSSQQTLTELWKPPEELVPYKKGEELVPYKKHEELVPYKEQIKNKFEAMINIHLSRDEISEQEAIYLFYQLKRIIDLSNETDIRNIFFPRIIYNKSFYDLVRSRNENPIIYPFTIMPVDPFFSNPQGRITTKPREKLTFNFKKRSLYNTPEELEENLKEELDRFEKIKYENSVRIDEITKRQREQLNFIQQKKVYDDFMIERKLIEEQEKSKVKKYEQLKEEIYNMNLSVIQKKKIQDMMFKFHQFYEEF